MTRVGVLAAAGGAVRRFAMTLALRPAMAAAAGAVVVSVSSSPHLPSPVLLDDRNADD